MNAMTSRLAGIGAVLFVILLVAGVFIGINTPDSNAPDAEWVDYVHDNDKLVTTIIGAYLMVIAGVMFLVFLASMFTRLRAAEPDSPLPLIFLLTGTAWSIAQMTGGLLTAVVAGGIKFGDAVEPSGEIARWMEQIGFGIWLIVGGLSAALMAAVLSFLVLRARLLPAWLAYFGFLAAIAMLAAAFFIPMIVFVLWMLVMGIVLITRGDEPAAATA